MPESAKKTPSPIRADKVARLRCKLKYEFGPPNKVPYCTAVMVHHGACENSMGGN